MKTLNELTLLDKFLFDEVMDIPDTNENLIKIHNHVRQVKADEEIGGKFMQRWEEEAMRKREGREAGLADMFPT